MSAAKQAVRPLAVCSRCLGHRIPLNPTARTFATLQALREELQQQPSDPNALSPPLSEKPILDPNTVSTVSEEARLLKHQNLFPIGSRRRRAALKSTSNIPFEQLPYQCFQEARKVLTADREEKVLQIEDMRARIGRLLEQDPAVSGGLDRKQRRLDSMKRELERLKILADINDPMVKKRFEDGDGDMNKPIYRYLADKKWRSYKRNILMQRITQMNVIPDVLPNFEPVLDVDLIWNGRVVPPGEYVASMRSQHPPTLRMQAFNKGERLVTIVAVDSDVPNLETNGFDYRCHGVWANIKISPVNGNVDLLSQSAKEKAILPWMPPFAQKGSPYHRISLFILEQPEGKVFSKAEIEKTETVKRDRFVLRSFVARTKVKPVGVTMFRCEWDEGTAAVMMKAGIPGADIELKREKPMRLPEKYRRKDGLRYRGWKK